MDGLRRGLLRHAASRGLRSRFLCSAAAPTPTVAHVLGGAVFFAAAERGTAHALAACDLRLPPSITALCALGALSSIPALGAPLNAALGPAAAWMRGALPVLLVPAFLFPAVVEMPPSEQLPVLAFFGAAGVVATVAATGHTAAALVRAAPPLVVDAHAASAAAASALLSSRRTAALALVGGAALSAALSQVAGPSRAACMAPAYVGVTVAAYVAAARALPAAVKKFCPPNVGCAIVLALFFSAWGGSEEVRCYLDGAGAALLVAVQPCMVTLGLYAHTHRAVLVQQRLALLALCAVTCPLLLFGLGAAGAALGLPAENVASFLPASTTTGLALLMPSGMPLAKQEWIAAGTAFNSGVVQLTLPLLLAGTALASRSAFARGVGIGCTAHVGGMVALLAAGETAAADAAAVVLVVVGVARSLLIQFPPFSRALAGVCEGRTPWGGDDERRRGSPTT